MNASRLSSAILLAALLILPACSDVTDVRLLEIESEGVIGGRVFVDLDGSGGPSAPDEPFEGAEVVIVTPSAGVAQRARTDSAGFFIFSEVPVGTYSLTLDSAALGDTLLVIELAGSVVVGPGDSVGVSLGATFPILTLEEVLVSTPGREVFTSGIALNARVNFGDGQVHFAGGTSFLRGIDVDRSPVVAGDSVRVRGRVVVDNGRVALQRVAPFVLVPQARLVLPSETTVARASTADGGDLDAALIRIRDAEITDTTTGVDGHFHFLAYQASDTVEVVVRDFLGLNTSAFRPDTIVRLDRLTGLLSPFDDGSGAVRWRILPRSVADVGLEFRESDLLVSLTLDTAAANVGDTVEVTVIVENVGPLAATASELRVPIPPGIVYVTSATSSGSYSAATGTWSVGDMGVAASDTLALSLEITDGTPRTVGVRAESLGSLLEVDPVSSNNVVVVNLTIS